MSRFVYTVALTVALAGCLDAQPLGAEYLCGGDGGCPWGFVCDTRGEVPVCVTTTEREAGCQFECVVQAQRCVDGDREICRLDADGCPSYRLSRIACEALEACSPDGGCAVELAWSEPMAVDGALNAVWVVGPDSGYLAGDALYRVEGSTIGEAFRPSAPLRAVTVVGVTTPTVVAVGDSGVMLRGDGASFVETTESGAGLRAVAGRDLENIWVVGDEATVLRCDAFGCEPQLDIPATISLPTLRTVWVDEDGDVFVAGDTSTMWQRNATGWVDWSLQMRPNANDGLRIFAAFGLEESGDVLFVDGWFEVLRFDGAQVNRQTIIADVRATPTSVFATHAANIWVVGGRDPAGDDVTARPVAYHSSDGSFGRVTPDPASGDLTGIHGTSKLNVWRVGTTGDGNGTLQRLGPVVD
ncbi:MAG: hypothetical protein ACI9MR_002393 [Myxococcota bacterium]